MIDWMEKARRRLRIEDMIEGSTPMNAFDQFRADMREELAGACWGQSVIEVADTMHVSRNGSRATASRSPRPTFWP
jgi:hypothetical protein